MPSATRSPRSRRAACSLAHAVVVDGLGGGVQRRRVAPAVVGQAGERGEREGVVGDEVAPAQLDRVDAQLEGGVVDEPFEEGRGLGPSGAAVGAHRGGVGDGDDDVELDGREAVRAVRHPLRAGRQERTDARVGATVADEADPQPGERPVAAATQLGVLDLATRVGERDEVVAARGCPRDRPVEMTSCGGDRRVLGADPRLATERAADAGSDHVHVAGFEAEHAGELPLHRVRHLVGGVERQPSVAIRERRRTSWAPSARRPCAGSRTGRARRRR